MEGASASLADANTFLEEMTNDTEVQIEKGRRLDYICSWPSPMEAVLTSRSADSFGVMPNMEACAWDDIDSHVPLSLKQKEN